MEECKAFHLPLVCSPQTPSQASSGTLSHQYYLDQPSDQSLRGYYDKKYLSEPTYN